MWSKLQGKELHAKGDQVIAFFDGPSLVAFSFQLPSAQQMMTMMILPLLLHVLSGGSPVCSCEGQTRALSRYGQFSQAASLLVPRDQSSDCTLEDLVTHGTAHNVECL